MAMPHDNLRKAAILVATLDQASADAVLEQMGDEQAALVRSAIISLDHVDPTEQDRVIADFLESDVGEPDGPSDGEAGVELDPSLRQLLGATAETSAGPTNTTVKENTFEPDRQVPFRFLHEAATDTLTAFLQDEHPQIAAIVVANLPPPRAARVVAGLPPSIRGEVLARVGRKVETDPHIVHEVESGLRHIITRQMAEDSRRAAGVGAVRNILDALDDVARSDMLGSVAEIDTDLAELLGRSTGTPFRLQTAETTEPPDAWSEPLRLRPRKPRVARQERPTEKADGESAGLSQGMHCEPWPADADDSSPHPARREEMVPGIQFEDLIELDDESLALVFERAEPHVAFLALAAAPIALVDRITRQLSTREARTLRKRIENIGPLRLMDIELAQRQIAGCAAELSREGRFALPAKRFSAAA